MILGGEIEQASIFIGWNQLESPAIAGFFRISGAAPGICRCASGVVAGSLDRKSGSADVAFITGKKPRWPAAREKTPSKRRMDRFNDLALFDNAFIAPCLDMQNRHRWLSSL
jgi:hypothetical protein